MLRSILVWGAIVLGQNVARGQNLAIGRSFAIHQNVARREGLLRVNRANGQFSSAAAQEGLNVCGLRHGGGHRSVLQGPLLFGRVNHAKIVDASIGLRRSAGFHQVRNGDGRQQPDNRHDDHDLD